MPSFLTCPDCGEATLMPASGIEWTATTKAKCGCCDAEVTVVFADPDNPSADGATFVKDE